MRTLLMLGGALLFTTMASAQPLPPPSSGAADMTLPGANAAGRFYGPVVIGTGVVAQPVGAANRLMAQPVYMRAGSTLKNLSFNITTGNAAAWNARMCLYADSGQGLPGALVSDAGTVAVASGSVTGLETATISGGGIVLGGGWYWEAFMADSAGESLSSSAANPSGLFTASHLLGWPSLAAVIANNYIAGVYAAQTFGACPTTFPGASFGDQIPIPYVIMGY